MRIAVLYTGYHYCYRDTYNIDRKIRNINWKNTYVNQRKNIFDDLKSKYDAEIDFFISTYSSNYDEELLKDFNPKKYVFNSLSGENLSNPHGRYNSIINGLNMLSDNYNDYELIMFLRFDLFLINPITKLKIDTNKLNISFLNYCGTSYDDIFAFSISNSKQFLKIKQFIESDHYKNLALCGGHAVHIQINDFKYMDINLLITDGDYKMENGWQVNINPIYFYTSQMSNDFCYLCFNKFDSDYVIFDCNCKYHNECYYKFHKHNTQCVKCRNYKKLKEFE
jgi:hypothetical protein